MSLSPEVLKSCWVLAGPTAGGKTATSIELARRINAEVISMDSMAVYRGMDIGTAKPLPDEQSGIPHHLIDVVDPHADFSVTEYLELAGQAVREILDRGRIPLFVGGTGLYLRSLLRGVFNGPDADWDIRQRYQTQSQANGPEWLLDQLRQVDPTTAARLHANDRRRVIRALEVYELTGTPLSEQQQQQSRPETERPAAVFWLNPDRAWLHNRINTRVDRMMQAGLLEETAALLKQNPAPGRTACQALGYRELIAHLQGQGTLEEAVKQIKTATRQFAKRQCTWFRNLEECQSFPITGDETAAQIAESLIAQTRQQTRPQTM
jgi:tRNA dimethylallyltransferase